MKALQKQHVMKTKGKTTLQNCLFPLIIYASNIHRKCFLDISGCLNLSFPGWLFSRSSAPVSVSQRAPGGPVSQTARGKQCAKTAHAYTGAEATQVTRINTETLTHTLMTAAITPDILGRIGHITVVSQSSWDSHLSCSLRM